MNGRRRFGLRLPGRTLVLGERTLVMGVVNVTPDSFSDGGLSLDPAAAVERSLELERAGADIVDVGGESTRPGARPVPVEVEIERVLPVLEKLRGRLTVPISIDTSKARVADLAAAAGAEILNDVRALAGDPAMAEVARRRRLAVILMHMRGRPRSMQRGPFARNALADVRKGLAAAVRRAHGAGLRRDRILLDPGIGFGKNFRQNFELLAQLPALARLGFPLVVGPSRKAFIGAALGGAETSARAWGTAATVTAAVLGGAHIVRVHDVSEMAQVVRVADAMFVAGARISRSGRAR
jgi:dihydropteroate synthase